MRLTDEGYLPEGVHECSWLEFTEVFVVSFGLERGRREQLAAGVLTVLYLLKDEQVEQVFIGGSFVTGKILPRDVDVATEVSAARPVRTWSHKMLREAAMGDEKARATFKHDPYFVDLWTVYAGIFDSGRKVYMADAWQRTRPDSAGDSRAVGIVRLQLSTLPPR